MRFPVVGELVKFPGSVSAGEVLNHKGHKATPRKKAQGKSLRGTSYPWWSKHFVGYIMKLTLAEETRDEKIRRLAGNVHLLPPMPTEHAVVDSVFSPAIVTRPLS
jgi:hypothetical protein